MSCAGAGAFLLRDPTRTHLKEETERGGKAAEERKVRRRKKERHK